MSLNFCCPNCSDTTLEEIMVNVCVASTIRNVDDDGNVEYDEQTNTDGEIVCYQCDNCGYVLENETGNVTTPEDLAEWLKKSGKVIEH